MDTKYNTKADLYDRYRWDYPTASVEYLCNRLKLGPNFTIADIGAGTGILTKHFIPIAVKVYAVEPDNNMFAILDNKFNHPNLEKICSTSDKLSIIPDNSLDLITAAHAINWFDFDKTLPEFGRILKKDGHLTTFANQSLSTKEYDEDMKILISKYKTPDTDQRKDLKQSVRDYCSDIIEENEFHFSLHITIDNLIGSLMSMAYLPDHTSQNIKEFEDDVKVFFERHSKENKILLPSKTTVTIGKLKR